MLFTDDTDAALQAAVALVNSTDEPGDPLGSVDDLSAFLASWPYTGRVDATRVDVQMLRAITVTGGVKAPSVHLADGATTVLSLVAKAGGAIRPGGDSRVYIVRNAETTREVSVADRIADVGIRSSDQLYVQDPPFVVRNELAIRSGYELVQFGLGLLTIFYLVRDK